MMQNLFFMAGTWEFDGNTISSPSGPLSDLPCTGHQIMQAMLLCQDLWQALDSPAVADMIRRARERIDTRDFPQNISDYHDIYSAFNRILREEGLRDVLAGVLAEHSLPRERVNFFVQNDGKINVTIFANHSTATRILMNKVLLDIA
jgi:hypothetical protein